MEGNSGTWENYIKHLFYKQVSGWDSGIANKVGKWRQIEETS